MRFWSSLADATKAALFFSFFFSSLRRGFRFRRDLYGGREPSKKMSDRKRASLAVFMR